MQEVNHVDICEQRIKEASEIRVLCSCFPDDHRGWLLITKEQASSLLWRGGFNYDYDVTAPEGGSGKFWISVHGRFSSVHNK